MITPSGNHIHCVIPISYAIYTCYTYFLIIVMHYFLPLCVTPQVWMISILMCICLYSIHLYPPHSLFLFTVSPMKQTPIRFRGFEDEPKITNGVISWVPAQQSKLIKALILDLKPEQFAGQIPCLLAHVIFMCLRHPDQSGDLELANQFMEGVASAIHQVTQVRY